MNTIQIQYKYNTNTIQIQYKDVKLRDAAREQSSAYQPIIKQEEYDADIMTLHHHHISPIQNINHNTNNNINSSFITIDSSDDDEDDSQRVFPAEEDNDELMHPQQQIDAICRQNGWKLDFAQPIDSEITLQNYKSLSRRNTILYEVNEEEINATEREAESGYI